MKFIPSIIPKGKSKNTRFVVLDIGLGRVNVAIFDSTDEGPKFVGVGRRSFNTFDTVLDATMEATDALGAVVNELPRKAVLGVCGGKLETITKIARYTREKPKQPIDEEEIAKVLEQISQTDTPKNLKVFFSTVTGAKVDETKVTNPIGLKGDKVEIACFLAFKPEEELKIYDQIIDELEIKPEKIVPSSFVVSRMYSQKNPENVFLVRIGSNKTEIAQRSEGHLVKVSNFDVGTEQIDFFPTAMEVVLQKLPKDEKVKKIWLYGDSDEADLEPVKEVIEKLNWKKLGFEENPKVEIATGEGNFGFADMGLLALSLEEILK